jgi:hypothetical protein
MKITWVRRRFIDYRCLWGKEDGANQNFEKHITENGTIVLKFSISVRKSRENVY